MLWVEVTRHLHFVDETPRYRAPDRIGKVVKVHVLIRFKTDVIMEMRLGMKFD